MAVLEITTDKPVLFSKQDVFFVTFKRTTNAEDNALIWFDDDSESSPQYWQIERVNCSNYTPEDPFIFNLPYAGADGETTISLAFSLRQDLVLPESVSLKINARITTDSDVSTTRLYYQHTYNPFEDNSALFTGEPNYNIPYEKDGTRQLLRTNPKLTGNIKITVDSSNNVWLNTMDANLELASSRFKKYKVSPGSSYALDLKRLLDDGRVDAKTVFQVLDRDDYSVKTEPSDQYEPFYWSGCEYLASLSYDEPYSIFAPLWIDSNVPDYFVIFASNDVVFDPTKSNAENFKNTFIKNSRIVKSFSMKSGTPIGDYIRTIINSSVYKASPIKANFENLKSISYRGVDYRNGVYTEKNELIDDFISEDLPITFFEKDIIDGFERNGLICYNLLNLEFLFQDDAALEYDIKRYYGFFINENEISEFIIDSDAYAQEYSWVPAKRLVPYNEASQEIYDINGISILADLSNQTVRLPSTSLVDEGERLFYVKGKNDLYKIDYIEIASRKGPNLDLHDVGRIITSSTFLDLQDITGFSGTKFIADSKIVQDLGYPFDLAFASNLKDADAISIIYQKGKTQIEWKAIGNSYAVKLGKTLPESTRKEPVILQQNLQLSSVTEYDTFNVGVLVIPEILDFQVASDIFVTYGGKTWELEIAKVEKNTSGFTTSLYLIDRTFDLLKTANIGETFYVEYSYEFIYNYFNPNGSFKDSMTSLKAAFDTMTDSKFVSTTKESGIHLRTIFEPGAEFKLKVDISNNHTQLSDVKIHTIPCTGYDIGSEVLKIAIVDVTIPETRHLFSVPSSFQRNIEGTEWVRSINGNKMLRMHSFQGSEIAYLQNEDSTVIELELVDNALPDLGKESKAVFYNLHKNEIGVMSFIPISDFDVSYLESDYSYLPSEELKMFFYEYSAGENIPMNGIWKITGEQGVTITINAVLTSGESIEVSSFVLDNDKTSGNYIIHTIPALYSQTFGNIEVSHFIVTEVLPADVNKKIKIQHAIGWQKPSEITGYSVEGLIYERDLKNFEGFNGIVDFLDSSEIETINSLKNDNKAERFFYAFLQSEYDRLRENYSKELFNISRTSPYSMKWVIKNGSDVRSNPYRLNANLAFGAMGFSPDNSIEKPTSMFHTHEWYYIEGMPAWYTLDAAKHDQNYTFSSVTNDGLLELDYDGFSRAFIRGSYKENYAGTTTSTKTTNLFVNVEYNKELNKVGVFFKGAKFDIQVDNPAIYDKWRFSAVLRPMRRAPFTASENVKMTLIENKKWKTLTLVIDAYLPSYIFPDGNINILGLYTTSDSKILSIDSLGGIYSTFADLALSSGMNPTFGSALQDSTEGTVFLPSYDSLLDQIKVQENGRFNDLRLYGYGRRYLDSVLTNLSIQMFGNSVYGISQSGLYFNYDTSAIEFSDSAPAYEMLSLVDQQFNPPIHIDHQFDIAATFKNSNSYYIKGGQNALSRTIADLSFAALIKRIQSNDWTHHSIDESGNEIIASGGDYISLEYVAPSKISKKKLLEPYPDTEIPTELTTYDVIGYSMTETDNKIEIYRYGGDFIPKMIPVVNFTSTETKSFVDEFGDLDISSNTHFFTEYSGFGTIPGMGIHKVADKKILTLADTSYESRYPLVDETGIDYRDLSIFSGTWDQAYYQQYPDKKNPTYVDPLFESKEHKAFFGSKLVNTPPNLLWEDFTYESFKSTSVDFWYEIADKTTLQIHLLTDNIIFNALNTQKLKDNVLKSIQHLRNDDLYSDEFVEEYIRVNLVKLYKVASIRLYSRGGTEAQAIYLNTTAEERDSLGFREDPGITLDQRLEDILIKRSIVDLSNPQFTLSITFDKI